MKRALETFVTLTVLGLAGVQLALATVLAPPPPRHELVQVGSVVYLLDEGGHVLGGPYSNRTDATHAALAQEQR